ncbi:MAG: DUF4998 domain-containing protein [Bacteroidales bacterium]|nr:DUF4998 domain-containing protein [Bacteroidales bacterium]
MKKILYFLSVTLITLGIFSCKDQDEVYKEFVVLNGITYPQKADSLRAVSGYNRLILKWMKPMDPSVVKARVYWNNYTDSLDVDLTNVTDDWVNVSIPDLGEGTYTFNVRTFDKDGNSSILTEATGTSYGEYYKITLTERLVENATRDRNYTGTIKWGAVTSDLAYTEIRYVSNSGEKKVVRMPANQNTIECLDAKPAVPFEFRSSFVPSSGLDTISLDWTTYDTPFMYQFSRDDWTAEAKNGNHDWGDGKGGFPYLVFDGDKTSGWHSKVGSSFPQVFSIDMKQSQIMTSCVIVPPSQTNWRYWVDIQVYVGDKPYPASDPDASWGEPAASVTYDGSSEFTINFPEAITGRYVALVFPNSLPGSPYISFMEFSALGY